MIAAGRIAVAATDGSVRDTALKGSTEKLAGRALADAVRRVTHLIFHALHDCPRALPVGTHVTRRARIFIITAETVIYKPAIARTGVTAI